MWPWTDWKLRRALRRYRRERDLEAVLQMDWHRDLDLSAFFTDVEERLHGEEITRLRQKQAEYLALQNQINPHFLYNALEAIRTDALLANCPDIAETTEALATFFRYTISNVQEYVTFSDELDNAENYFTISAADSVTKSLWNWSWRTSGFWKCGCRSSSCSLWWRTQYHMGWRANWATARSASLWKTATGHFSCGCGTTA